MIVVSDRRITGIFFPDLNHFFFNVDRTVFALYIRPCKVRADDPQKEEQASEQQEEDGKNQRMLRQCVSRRRENDLDDDEDEGSNA